MSDRAKIAAWVAEEREKLDELTTARAKYETAGRQRGVSQWKFNLVIRRYSTDIANSEFKITEFTRRLQS